MLAFVLCCKCFISTHSTCCVHTPAHLLLVQTSWLCHGTMETLQGPGTQYTLVYTPPGTQGSPRVTSWVYTLVCKQCRDICLHLNFNYVYITLKHFLVFTWRVINFVARLVHETFNYTSQNTFCTYAWVCKLFDPFLLN